MAQVSHSWMRSVSLWITNSVNYFYSKAKRKQMLKPQNFWAPASTTEDSLRFSRAFVIFYEYHHRAWIVPLFEMESFVFLFTYTRICRNYLGSHLIPHSISEVARKENYLLRSLLLLGLILSVGVLLDLCSQHKARCSLWYSSEFQ